MNTIVARTVRFLLALTIACGVAFGAEEAKITLERITFVNFSDQPIEVFRVGPDESLEPVRVVAPYEAYTQRTSSGDTFRYDSHGEGFTTQVSSTTGLDPNENREVQIDEDAIPSQIHPMGKKVKKVTCGTTKGDIHINVQPEWSPYGAARFLDLIAQGYYEGCALNRVVPGFLVQFGIGADPVERNRMEESTIPDDVVPPRGPVRFEPGYMSYAGNGPDSRSTEVFVVQPGTAQSQLDYFGTYPWETPFAYVEETDLSIVGKWHSYGDMPPYGDGPDPLEIYPGDGYDYLQQKFPELDYIHGCRIVPDADSDDPSIVGLGYEELAAYISEDEDEKEEVAS